MIGGKFWKKRLRKHLQGVNAPQETNALARGSFSLTDDKEVEANEADKY
jgi:hypothetical protein